MDKGANPLLRTLLYVVLIGVGVIVYAYGWQVTEISLEAPFEERRQQQVGRALRGLLTPDLFARDEASMEAAANFLVPCGAEPGEAPEADGQQSVTLEPVCGAGEGGEKITIGGSNFRPRTRGYVYWVQPDGQSRPIAAFDTDGEGNFETSVTAPKADEAKEPYRVRVAVKWPVGAYRPSEALIITVEKMIETVFLALMATTLAIPIAGALSFLAANNLMRQITTPAAGLLAGLLVTPLGWIAGTFLFGGAGNLGVRLGSMMWPGLIGLGLVGGLVYAAAADIVPRPRIELPGVLKALTDLARTVIVGAVAWIAVGFLTGVGQWIATGVSGLGSLGSIIGNFLGTLTTILELLLPPLGGILGAVVVFGLASGLAERSIGRVRGLPGRAVGLVLGALAFGMVFGGVGMGAAGFYQASNPVAMRNTAALVGAGVGAVIGAVLGADRPFPLGMVIYFTTRSILNSLRAIEPLIMAIVFAIWVGIGPFAGVLALTLHSIAALGKLYSEQVESIDPGPIEAIQATGANRLQTVVYGVIPQIVPPYISFTIYRWDINVRMSTIIGFVGGGGIGFILQQWINLLRYQQAGVAMFAIAIVVATLDFVSAWLREAII
jgi:phosphonate ABC transporter permease subunit PhnE